MVRPRPPTLRPVHYDLNKVIASHDLQLHQYADDCQVCVTTSVDDAALAVDRLAGCIADVGAWTSSSRLRLNSSKTQAIWLAVTRYSILYDISDSLFRRLQSTRVRQRAF